MQSASIRIGPAPPGASIYGPCGMRTARRPCRPTPPLAGASCSAPGGRLSDRKFQSPHRSGQAWGSHRSVGGGTGRKGGEGVEAGRARGRVGEGNGHGRCCSNMQRAQQACRPEGLCCPHPLVCCAAALTLGRSPPPLAGGSAQQGSKHASSRRCTRVGGCQPARAGPLAPHPPPTLVCMPTASAWA